jgi:gamma-glutamylcyclotransferase (GGCT)/AIG2-like uncharacterized protein YtfP
MVRQVFVYGTLKRGFSRSLAFAGLRRRAEAADLEGMLYDLGTYPGLKLEGDDLIQGEIHLFDDIGRVLRVLDLIEGYRGEGHPGNLFRRTLVTARDRRGRRRSCWAYVYCGPTLESQRIIPGVWTRSS